MQINIQGEHNRRWHVRGADGHFRIFGNANVRQERELTYDPGHPLFIEEVIDQRNNSAILAVVRNEVRFGQLEDA